MPEAHSASTTRADHEMLVPSLGYPESAHRLGTPVYIAGAAAGRVS